MSHAWDEPESSVAFVNISELVGGHDHTVPHLAVGIGVVLRAVEMPRCRAVHRPATALVEIRGLACLAFLCIHIAGNHEWMVVKLPSTTEERVHVGDQLGVRQQVAERLTVRLLPGEHPAKFVIRWSLVAVVAFVPVRIERCIQRVDLALGEEALDCQKLDRRGILSATSQADDRGGDGTHALQVPQELFCVGHFRWRLV